MSELLEQQRDHLFYTWTAQQKAAPLEIVGGQGARFQTADGDWWWDLGSTTWNANLGHGHPVMAARLAEAAGRGLVAGPTAAFPDKARAGQLLAEVTPKGLTKSFICLSGAEANENAIKMARMVTGRSKVVARTRSYHGATLAMLSLSGDPRRELFEPGLPGVLRMTDPYCYRCKYGLQPATCQRECAQDLETTLMEAGPETVAAVIVEGVTGANGVFPPPSGYFQRLRQICDRYGVLLIADEVLSGFGRTGRWFAIDHEGVSPDILTCAKGLTAGYAPGGAVVVNDRVARHFEDHVLFCGLTTYAHPLVCAAICAAIDVYKSESVIENSARLGQWLGPRLEQLRSTRPFVGEVRGLGLLWALELVEAGGRQPASAADMDRLYATLKKNRVYAHRRDNLLYLAPPLVIQSDQLEACLQAVETSLDQVFN
ncbi:aminotransferase class III-fold pyridoxal phosphate-dependent enzyme [bacterium]|nr:aminotransferase class III-fold pyridoxal phosphate-dependent enzyme [bacterium]